MKNLYLIGGAMGAGKTTVGQLLKVRLQNSVFLDGDWCWDMHPFQVTEETRAMALDNITHLLANFLACSAFDNVIFTWVMHEQDILSGILSKLPVESCHVRAVSLVLGEAALIARLEKDVAAGLRSPDIIKRSVSRLPLYERLDTVKIDVSDLSATQVADQIILL